MYAQYFVKYIQSYQAAGVPVNYVSVQNEPNCCQAGNPTAMNYPGMSWNSSGLVEFTKNHLYPAFRAAGITTKVLIHDWNYGDYGQHRLGRAGRRRASATTRSSAASPGTATSATRPSAPRCTTSTRPCTSSAPSTPAAPGSATSTTRTWPTSSTTPATGAAAWSSGAWRSTRTWARTTAAAAPAPGWSPSRRAARGPARSTTPIEYYTTGHLTKFVKPGRVPDRLDRQRHGARTSPGATRTAPRR